MRANGYEFDSAKDSAYSFFRRFFLAHFHGTHQIEREKKRSSLHLNLIYPPVKQIELTGRE